MFYRKDAVFMAVAGILASAGFAVADNTAVKTPVLTLDPVATVDNAPDGLLMQGLGKVPGAGDALKQAGINIYGWVEGGYTYDHRHGRKTVAPILPGPFNHEFGGSIGPLGGHSNGYYAGGTTGGDRNHFMLDQVDLRFERTVRSDKWDVGGLIEVQYGTDADAIHSNGLAMGNESYQGSGGSNQINTGKNADDRFNPQYQFDLTQAYIDVNVPVGNGLIIRTGKFVTLMGYETLDPRGNPFYSHSYLFSAIPFTHTGVLGIYNFNDQWKLTAGFSRGWDQSVEDNNGSAIDTIGQLVYTPNKQWQAILNWSVGPEDDHDTSHYRTAIDGILRWKATDKLTLGFEAIYVYDGGRNADGISQFGFSHAYGDQWGGALYGAYMFNDYCTLNLRLEKFHDYAFSPLDQSALALESLNSGLGGNGGAHSSAINFYSITAGVAVHPFPKDPIGKNLVVRPEVRYTYSEDHIFFESSGAFKDQLVFAADVIFGF